jgi:spore photoproduct lyase
MTTTSAPHLDREPASEAMLAPETIAAIVPARAPKRWIPKIVLVTPAALAWEHGRAMVARAEALGCEVVRLGANRLAGLRSDDVREQYVRSKATLAIVTSPPGQRKLQPIPPSADWQFHLAEGCPAHCQYCYLAGSLHGPPITRAYANLPEILDGLRAYVGAGTVTSRSRDRAAEGTTFEASCYTDPLGIEHLTGSLAETIRFFGASDADMHLRFTTKFDALDDLLSIAHDGRTRMRFSVNAEAICRRFEGGTASLPSRVAALRRAALAGYPVGLTIAPIVAFDGWEAGYDALLARVAHATADIGRLDLTVELITHRFTPGSKDVLTQWYPASKLEMDEARRTQKRTKFGSVKYVYPKETMRAMRAFITDAIAARLPAARILYWT